jgi:predicted small metal-binding protein
MKRLECNDLVSGCGAVVEAETEEEILEQAGKHAVQDHGIALTPEFVQQARSKIQDVPTPS